MITKNGPNYDDLNYYGDVRFLFSLDSLEFGTYQYHYDCYGVRNITEGTTFLSPETYFSRPDIHRFFEEELTFSNSGNEVMLKEFVSSEYITGIIVRDEILKQKMIDHLRSQNLVRMGFDGREWIGKFLLEDFILVKERSSFDFFGLWVSFRYETR